MAGTKKKCELTKSQAKREKILDAAALVFSVKGYSEATLTDIAREAGTHAGSLYYHFTSRDHIVREVLSRAMNPTAKAVQEVVENMPPDSSYADRIRAGMVTYMERILVKDNYLAAFHRIIDQVPKEVRADYVKHPRAYGRFWRNLIEEGQAAGEIRPDLDSKLIMLNLLGSANHTQQWYHADGPARPKDFANALVDIYLGGIATTRPATVEVSEGKSRKPARKAAVSA